jgi:hypothetical protein
MNGTTPLNTPCMIYHWKEERKGNLECHLRISVSLRRLELWGGFGNRLEFGEINAQYEFNPIGDSLETFLSKSYSSYVAPYIRKIGPP